jgi:hypothetical protein
VLTARAIFAVGSTGDCSAGTTGFVLGGAEGTAASGSGSELQAEKHTAAAAMSRNEWLVDMQIFLNIALTDGAINSRRH